MSQALVVSVRSPGGDFGPHGSPKDPPKIRFFAGGSRAWPERLVQPSCWEEVQGMFGPPKNQCEFDLSNVYFV